MKFTYHKAQMSWQNNGRVNDNTVKRCITFVGMYTRRREYGVIETLLLTVYSL